MNFPPILYQDKKFSNIIANNYHNQNLSTILSYQNLYKKLLKFENKDENFQSSVLSWVQTLSKIQLIKYFSFSNQWLVDILHEMILINGLKPNTKFIFKDPSKYKENNENKENKEKKEEIPLSYFYLLDYQNISKYSPKYSDYFYKVPNGIINLSGLSESEKLQKHL